MVRSAPTRRLTGLCAVLLAASMGLGLGGAAQAAGDDDKPAQPPTARGSEHRDPRSTENRSQRDHSDGTAGTSGDAAEPQPISTADARDGGANGQCPEGRYCSTRDGSPSMNGKGDGEATGKPCAGCVGKADNKNPPGQVPDGSDGYECDSNQGIGKSNPAHTACTDSGVVPVVAGVEATRAGQAARQGVVARVSPAVGVLPQTGAGAQLALLGAAGLAMVAGGTVLLFRRRSASRR